MKSKFTGSYRHFFLAPAIALSLVAGCTDSAPKTETSAVENTATSIANQETGSIPASTPSKNHGLVRSAETAGAYTYIEVDIEGEVFWLATMVTAVQPGQSIAWQDYAMMRNFRSKALGREFERILFVDRIIGEQTISRAVQHGTVEESMNAAGYSFIRVDQNGSSIWLAAPETAISVGQSIRWSGGAAMHNFNSRSLDRSFEKILFVGAVHRS